MELPDSIKQVGEQLEAGREIVPDSEWFEAYPVFAYELANLMTRPWLAVDHASRLAADGDYFRADVGSRSVVLVREAADRIHALRNACLHAGYRVCEEEAGNGRQLFCQYHGWYYALDGRLTDPVMRPDLADRSRFRLPHFAMHIDRGLIFVDLTTLAPEAPPAAPIALGPIPETLAEGVVTRRQRYATTWNWKNLRQFLWAAPELVFADDRGADGIVEVGPLSFVALRGDEAALVRLMPRFPGHSDFVVVQVAPPGTAVVDADRDPLPEALRSAGDRIAAAPSAALDRSFYDWYWSALAPVAAQ